MSIESILSLRRTSYSFQARSKQIYIGLYILEGKMTEFMMDSKQHWSQKIKHFLRRRLFMCGGEDKAGDVRVLWRKQADGQPAALLQAIPQHKSVFYISFYSIISLWKLSCYLSVCPTTFKEISKTPIFSRKTKQVLVDRKSTLNVDFLLHNDETITQEIFGEFFTSKSPNLSRVNQEDLKHFILATRGSYIFSSLLHNLFVNPQKYSVNLTMSITWFNKGVPFRCPWAHHLWRNVPKDAGLLYDSAAVLMDTTSERMYVYCISTQYDS